MNLEEKTEKYLTGNYVDVCVGEMTLKEISKEIHQYFYYKQPSEMVVHIKKSKDGYYTAIYLRKEEFYSTIKLEKDDD